MLRYISISNNIKRYLSTAASSDEWMPRITVPQKMVERVHKLMTRKTVDEARSRGVKYKSPLVISCKRKQFNHHKGQTSRGVDPKILASHGWMHRKSVGDHFTIKSHKANPAVLTEDISFSSLGINTHLCETLRERLGIHHPTNIQKLSVPKILSGHNSLCVAETGSGKTYAYLLPIVELIDRQRELKPTGEITLNTPRFVIVVPAHEIAHQIKSVADGLSEITPFETRLFCGQQSRLDLARIQKEHIDLVIATPGALTSLLRFNKISPSRLQQLVLDEVDTLMDDSFKSTICTLLHKLKFMCGSPSGDTRVVSLGTQVVMVGATLPRDMQRIIGDFIPTEGLETITTEHVHRLLPHVPQTFVRVLPSTKPEELLRLMKARQKGSPTLIFCNKRETAWWLAQFLDSNGVPNVMVYGRDAGRGGAFAGFQDGESDVLVATDVCSRGLDTLRVEHVINYEFPNFISDYIHRAGRVGRVRATVSGRVTSFVCNKWEVELLWNIESSARQSTELFNVNANIKRKITGIINKKFRSKVDSSVAGDT